VSTLVRSASHRAAAHLIRALLEGMARTFRSAYDTIQSRLPSSRRSLVGAGNGLRENPLLIQLVADEFDLPMRLPVHREEAAYGAALLAGVGAGILQILERPGTSIRYGQ
jgi:sugar (pentulose or hexulose) kinase